MRIWPFTRRRQPCPSEDARCALRQAQRALVDAEAQGRYADELKHRAEESRVEWHATRARNHFAEAIAESMRRARHP